MSMRKKDIGILKMPSARYVAKKLIGEVTESRLLNEASFESKKFSFIKCPRINLNYIIPQTFQKIDGIYQL